MWNKIRKILMVILAVLFLGSSGTVLYVKARYKINNQIYEAAAAQFTSAAPLVRPAEQGMESSAAAASQTADSPAEANAPEKKTDEASSPAEETAATEKPGEESTPTEKPKKPHVVEYAPIAVDFDALREINPDVEGWIYCEDSIINYPVLHGENNDEYLHNNYQKRYTVFGSIFADADNACDFEDYNTVLYGHHMQNYSMFASLEWWVEQEYYEDHPVMWLLTPEQDYKIVLFSAYTTSAFSDTYLIFDEPGEALDEYLKMAVEQSKIETDVELEEDAHYVVLSTCAYVFDYARSVVHGMLVPLDSAGGIPFPVEKDEPSGESGVNPSTSAQSGR